MAKVCETRERSALVHFHAVRRATDLSSREIDELAREGRIDLAITPSISVVKAIAEFHWTELRRLQPTLVMQETHPLAKLKRVPLKRLNDTPLVGLSRDNYPEYLPNLRRLLKKYGVSPRFVSLVNDGTSSLFAELEAHRAAVILTEGTIGIMPRSLTARPFTPILPDLGIMIGLPTSRPTAHAEAFARLLTEQARRVDRAGPRSKGK